MGRSRESNAKQWRKRAAKKAIESNPLEAAKRTAWRLLEERCSLPLEVPEVRLALAVLQEPFSSVVRWNTRDPTRKALEADSRDFLTSPARLAPWAEMVNLSPHFVARLGKAFIAYADGALAQ